MTEQVVVPIRKNTSFAGDTLKLASGTAFAQALAIIAAPILTRLYAPEIFGVAAVFTSIVSTVGVISCLRYQFAIMLPECDKEAANILSISIGFVVLISMLTILIVWFGQKSIIGLLNAPDLSPYIWFIPIAVFWGGVFLALNYWNSRVKYFGRLSVSRVVGSSSTVLTQLIAGLSGFATAGAKIGAGVLGQSLSTLILALQTWKEDGQLFRKSINWKSQVEGIKRYRKFPIYDTWSSLLNTISWQLPVLLLSTFFSSTVVGYYALGFRILQMPMSLLGSAIAQVFYQRAAEAKINGTLASLVESVFRLLVMIGLFPMLMLSVIGRDLFVLVFGQNWAEAGVYIQILSVWAFFWFISSPLSTLYNVLEKQEFGLKWNIVLFITRLFSLIIGGYFANARTALFLFAVSGIFVYGFLTIYILASSGLELKTPVRILLEAVLPFLPLGLIQITVNIVSSDILVRMIVSCILFGLFFLFLLKTQPVVYDVIRLKIIKLQNR